MELGWVAAAASDGPTADDERLGREVGRLLHLDDTDRLTFLLQGLAHGQPALAHAAAPALGNAPCVRKEVRSV
jgi:hypothetical protein